MIFNSEWHSWLEHNVARGCCRMDLYRDMIRAGIRHATAVAQLDRAYQVPAPIDAVLNPGARPWRRLSDERAFVYQIDEVLTPDECDAVIAASADRLRPAGLVGTTDLLNYRTNRTLHIADSPLPLLRTIDRRISRLVGVPTHYGEPLQVQVYRPGEQFRAHTDYFVDGCDHPELLELGQRTMSVLVFAQAPESGGETQFPELDLCIRPTPGSAIVWSNLLADGAPNPLTRHRARPAGPGRKTVLTKWFRSMSESFRARVIPTPAEQLPVTVRTPAVLTSSLAN